MLSSDLFALDQLLISTMATTVDSPEHLQELLSKDLSRVSCLYFRADWAEPCTQMDSVIIELAKRWPGVLFLSVRPTTPRPPW